MAEKILLTGGTGMVGFRTLVEALQRGHRVRAAVRNQEGIVKLQSHHLISPYLDQLEFVIVPDIEIEGAYDVAVQDVAFIIHIASPLPRPGVIDFEAQLVQPALRGTIGMLESGTKSPSVKRIVITASIGSIVPAEKLSTGDSEVIYNEKMPCLTPRRPFPNALAAYLGSKATASQAVAEFIVNEKPSYDVISIMPGYIIGRNDLVTETRGCLHGTNRTALSQILGQPSPNALPSTTAFLNDVAKAHVLCLDSSIQGNQNLIISSDGLRGATWGDAIDVVSEHYPKDVIKAAGFNLDAGKTPTVRVSIDASHSQKVLGFEFAPYREQVISITDHYIELSKSQKSE